MLASDASIGAMPRGGVSPTRHIAGTARIRPEADRPAVLDQFCPDRDDDGLRVVDASMMPPPPSQH
jgi:choline dehydrogenase-like flavoprotein